jgi:ubiquinone/menaquinone biosynthesis C-methylase UbiE
MMTTSSKDIVRHYESQGLQERILEAIRKVRGSLDGLTVDDLAPVDGFHIRGRQSTIELAELAGLGSELRVLDIGSGPGGSARYLASQHRCSVVGLDITPGYVALARRLSSLVALDHLTAFTVGSAEAMAFDDAAFDLVWSEHVQMNVKDKDRLVQESCRVLKPRGRLVMHEVFRGPQGDPYLPAPWASDASASFIIEAKEMREHLEHTGWQLLKWRDVTEVSREWFGKLRTRMSTTGPPMLGIHLLLGPDGLEKIRNIGRSLEDGRATVIQAVFEKPDAV